MRKYLRRGGRGSAAALVLVLLAAAPAVAQEDFALSVPEENLWRWALVERVTLARTAPDPTASVVSRVQLKTPENTPEALPLLARREVDGRLWLKVRLPVLPNGTTGWVPRDAVGAYETVRTHLIIDRASFTMRLERRGRTVFRTRVGIGEKRWPTPAGSFMVRNRLSGFKDPVYGALAFGTTARSATLTDWPGGGFVGVHGTSQPGILPGRVSHGCVRMRNDAIKRLDRLMPLGTPVTIR